MCHPRLRYAAWLLALTLAGAAGCRPSHGDPKELAKEFSGQRALAHVQHLVLLGPRPSGSPKLEEARHYLEGQLGSSGWSVERQTFTDPTPHGPIQFINLIARFKGASADNPRAVVCTHYDTKWFDTQSFVGANDGGSGTGALVELARVLAADPGYARRFELVFFDGEEAIREFRVDRPPYDGLYGSRHYAHALSASGGAKQRKVGVLWDMIGDRNLNITLPLNSPANLVQGFFAASAALDTRRHFGYGQGDILDDHVPLNGAGIPTIDLIDFDFPPWHTPADTMDKISAESLQTVGQATLYHLGTVVPGL